MATREEMHKEAIERLKTLKVMPSVIRDFKAGRLMVSEPPLGGLYWLDDDEKKMVEKVEKEFGGLVYHVVRAFTEFGKLDALLWVSQYDEEWEYEREDIADGIVFSYVVNHDTDWCSEFGSIQVVPLNGGLLRTA